MERFSLRNGAPFQTFEIGGEVITLRGTKAEARFEFIQERAEFAREDLLDV
jgi:hypothetical protein